MKDLEGNKDGNGSLPNVPAEELRGPTATSSPTSGAAAATSSSTSGAAATTSSPTLGAAATPSSPTSIAAVGPSSSTTTLRQGYRRGSTAERGRIVVQAGSQPPRPPTTVEETSGEWSVIEEV